MEAIRSEKLKGLVNACQQLGYARSMAEVMAVVRHAARELTGADGATFVLLEHNGDGDFCYYADEEAIAPLWKGARFPMDSCVSGWSIRNRATAVIPDIFNDERVPYELYIPTFVRSLVMSPLATDFKIKSRVGSPIVLSISSKSSM